MKTSQAPVWLVLGFPDLGLELRWRAGADPIQAQASFDPAAKAQPLVAVNEAAAAAGARPGQPQVQALSLLPELVTYPLNRLAEANALTQLATWAYRYSGQVRLESPDRIALELGGSLKLFGGLAGLLTQLRNDLQQMGFTAASGLGRSLSAARLRSQLVAGGMVECALHASGDLRKLPAIAQTPVALLPLDAAVISILAGSGISTLGALLKLPSGALRRRFGKSVEEYLQRLQNQRPEPGTSFQPAQSYRAELELPAATAFGEALWFPIRRLISDLCVSLRSLDLSVDSLRLKFEIERSDDGSDHQVALHARGKPTASGGLERPSAKPQIECQLVESSRDPVHLFELCRQRLERTQFAGKVLSVVLEVPRLPPPKVIQPDLLSHCVQQRADWPKLLERLRARLGVSSLLRPQALADHRPEHSSTPTNWSQDRARRQSATQQVSARKATARANPPPADLATQPSWLSSTANPINPRDIQVLGHAERIEGGWWDGKDVRRDYYRAVHINGGQCWVYREIRDPSSWFLHGWFG